MEKSTETHGNVWESIKKNQNVQKSRKRLLPGRISLPLTNKVEFKVQLQNQNRFQIPKIVRWEYKLEPSQSMRITLRISDVGFYESFLGKMLPDGRVTVPRIVIVTLQQRMPDLKASFIEVTLEPI